MTKLSFLDNPPLLPLYSPSFFKTSSTFIEEMGTNLWRCGQTSFKGSPLQDSKDQNVGLATSIIMFVKQTMKRRRKRQFHLHQQEKKQHLLRNPDQMLTLEEWILASPSLNLSFSGEGEFQVFKQTPNAQRIHPSLIDGNQETGLDKSMENFILERSNGGGCQDSSLLCRSQSGKIKKRVSFRLPEVADIFILDSRGDT